MSPSHAPRPWKDKILDEISNCGGNHNRIDPDEVFGNLA